MQFDLENETGNMIAASIICDGHFPEDSPVYQAALQYEADCEQDENEPEYRHANLYDEAESIFFDTLEELGVIKRP